MRIIYMYHPAEPAHGSVLPGSLPSPQTAYRGYVPLSLTQRVASGPPLAPTALTTAAQLATAAASPAVDGTVVGRTDPFWLELRHEDVELPAPDETRFWCRVFELPDFRRRHHLIRVRVSAVLATDKRAHLKTTINFPTANRAVRTPVRDGPQRRIPAAHRAVRVPGRRCPAGDAVAQRRPCVQQSQQSGGAV